MSFIASLGGPRTNQNSCIIFCCTSLVSQLPTASHRHLLPPLPTLTLMFWRDKGSGLVKSVSGFVYLFPCGFFDPVNWKREVWRLDYIRVDVLGKFLNLGCSVSCQAVPSAVSSFAYAEMLDLSIRNVDFPLCSQEVTCAVLPGHHASILVCNGFQRSHVIRRAWISYITSLQNGESPHFCHLFHVCLLVCFCKFFPLQLGKGYNFS